MAQADDIPAVNQKLIQWIKTNVSSQTGLPYSFQVLETKKSEVYGRMGQASSTTGIVERMIVQDGISIYDAGLWQTVLTALGTQEDLQMASLPVEAYWQGWLGKLNNIRAGFPGQPFIYDPYHPQEVSSDLTAKGRRGFVFRILNANGEYQTSDPLDGKKYSPGFPNSPDIHWEDWKPIAGENAWIVMGALHLYHKKYYDPHKRRYRTDPLAVEMLLAEEITRAGLLLQADNGGIRMAPLGTYYHLVDIDESATAAEIESQLDHYAEKVRSGEIALTRTHQKIGGMEYQEHHVWYYEEISTENNLSWYAALRMLYRITHNKIYKKAMQKLEEYFISVWDPEGHCFYQGVHFADGQWKPNKKYFATDVQSWALIILGPEKIDKWFGAQTSYRMWQAVKEKSGSYNAEGELAGVGFTQEADRISVEWSAGAILAARRLVSHYQTSSPVLAGQIQQDAQTMRNNIEKFRVSASEDRDAYAYSSQRDWIPFGWFSHNPDVLSLASSCWVALIDMNVNPFYLEY